MRKFRTVKYKRMAKQRSGVKVMHRSGTTEWKWPDKPDEVFYFERNVIQKISPPVPSGRRGRFVFNRSISF